MTPEEKTRLRKLAHKYLDAGINLVVQDNNKQPVKLNGRNPYLWKQYQTQMLTHDELDKMLDHPDASAVAAIGGRISGGGPGQWLVIWDYDHCAPEAYGAIRGWLGVEPEYGGFNWEQRLLGSLPLVRTSNDEYHCHEYMRVLGGDPPGCRDLAFTKENGVFVKMVEVKGEGGLCTCPGSLNKNGNFYKTIRGDLTKIPVVSYEQFEQMLSVVKSLNEKPEPVARTPIPPGAMTVEISALPPRLMELVTRGAGQGERNSKLMEVRCALIEYGLAAHDIDKLTDQFLQASGYGTNSEELAQIKATLRSAERTASWGSKRNIVRVA